MPSVSSRRGGRVCLAGALTATLTLVLWSVNASARQTVRSMVQTCAELRREIALNLVDVSHGYDTSPELVLVLTGDTMDCTEGVSDRVIKCTRSLGARPPPNNVHGCIVGVALCSSRLQRQSNGKKEIRNCAVTQDKYKDRI